MIKQFNKGWETTLFLSKIFMFMIGTIFRVLLLPFIVYYLYNWHVAVYLNFNCITHEWFYLGGVIYEGIYRRKTLLSGWWKSSIH